MKLNKFFVRKLSFSLFFFLISPVVSIVVGQSETAGEGIGKGYLDFVILLFVALIILVFALLFMFGMKEKQIKEEDLVLKTAKRNRN